jgi:hypothetical protein
VEAAASYRRNATSLSEVGDKFISGLVIERDPCRLAGGTAPGLTERAVVDGVETELIEQSRHQVDRLGKVARDRDGNAVIALKNYFGDRLSRLIQTNLKPDSMIGQFSKSDSASVGF